MSQYYHNTMRYITQMDSWQWFTVMVIILVMGIICLRGFGSRGGY